MISEVKGIDSLLAKLKAKAADPRYKDGNVIVGYTANYALWVHENREIHPPGMIHAGEPRRSGSGKGLYWDPQGQARPGFLLDVLRENYQRVAGVFREQAQRGIPLTQALYLAGLFLQALSMQAVPVDTGNLKASAFTKVEE